MKRQSCTHSILVLKNAFMGARNHTAIKRTLRARTVAADAPVEAFSLRFFLGGSTPPPSLKVGGSKTGTPLMPLIAWCKHSCATSIIGPTVTNLGDACSQVRVSPGV